ncbi:PIN domain-containing protein [Pandoraea commovens]|uniref:PIN domain-containing protein n=1 Tax=Pandoraea commovens TaxID=2508289 RepID=A0ABY5QK29_9BURK|nr:PIN domain-containing protein [Pandoraea commovens]UVA80503.1 PIN domain-containing protein [Pandoraea commovens]
MNEPWRELIQLEEITALSIDTSVLRANSYNFGSGLLLLLTQNVRAKLVISEVVVREVRRHLTEKAKESLRQVDSSLQDAIRQNVLGGVGVAAITDALKAARREPEDWAKQRLEEWLTAADASVINSEDHVDVAELMDRYFEARAPFSDKGNKKNEFPDALALLALEAWAEQNGTAVLVVSTDGDWIRYCNESAHLHCVADLADAINGFNGPTAENACKRLIESVRDGDKLGLIKWIESEFDREVANKWDYTLDGDSYFTIEDFGFDEFFVRNLNFDGAGALNDGNFEPLSMEAGVATVKVTVAADVTADAWVSLSKFDSIDRDYVSMGDTKVSVTEPVEFSVLVRLGGTIPDDMEIEGIDLLPMFIEFNAGEIEPDWSDRDYEE